MKPKLADTSSTAPFAVGLVDASRTWYFVTTTGGQQCSIMFYVYRLHNASDADIDRVTRLAGPLFTNVLERLSFESR